MQFNWVMNESLIFYQHPNVRRSHCISKTVLLTLDLDVRGEYIFLNRVGRKNRLS